MKRCYFSLTKYVLKLKQVELDFLFDNKLKKTLKILFLIKNNFFLIMDILNRADSEKKYPENQVIS